MTNFTFLKTEWPELYESAVKAEATTAADPRIACFYARRALELAVKWAYKHDASLRLPYSDNLKALVHEPTFKAAAGDAVFNKARILIHVGNQAVHEERPISADAARMAVRELFHVAWWFAHCYATQIRPDPSLEFDAGLLPLPASAAPKQSAEQVRQLEQQLEEREEKLSDLLKNNLAQDAELQRLRLEVAAARREAAALPDEHDYSEAETRDRFIDLLLNEAGWPLDQPRDTEFEVAGMANEQGKGFVDYVLWGDDGKPLGLVEAKRTRRDPRVGQQQAKLYADCLEAKFGRRPVIFYSNGYEHWMWNDCDSPPRPVQGFYKRDELELLIHRRTSRKPLAAAEINPKIVERYYQMRAVRRVCEAFEQDRERKTLLVMATGAGKTRTVIALSDLLIRCNWAKRVLFLADRVALVNQAVKAFKQHLPDCAPVNLVTEKSVDGRVFVSTYPSMMGLIEEMKSGRRRFGVGHFDLIIIDEAHRSVFQKYRAIFDYFDSLLVGLTATPKDEVDRNTYGLFDLESGVPTDAYSLEDAVNDRYLVPPKAVSVPLKFPREGIKYDELPEEEKDQWDALDWDEEEGVPERIDPGELNRWLFNVDTVDKVLEHLMTHGQKVAGGDRLGKTIVFAAGQAHAEFIVDRFNANYPHYNGAFARVIHNKVEYAQSIIDNFSGKDQNPHIAVSVDMLDTGIDVPEVVNLVFFKIVRSKTKFWQMVGRGTRLCPDLFGPGKDKQFFFIFDFCQNLEFFSQNSETTDGSSGDSLSKRLFTSRLDLIAELDERLKAALSNELLHEPPRPYGDPKNEQEVRAAVADLLQAEVAAMNVENFVVRPKRRLVEKYREPEPWLELSRESRMELAANVAGLPAALEAEPEEAKRFDLLLLKLQLAMLRQERNFTSLRDVVIKLASLLQEKAAIPMVRAEMELILDIQAEEWWQDVTIPMLERVRRRLRGLIHFIDRHDRRPVYSDFEDEMGESAIVDLPGFASTHDFEQFKAKAEAFLKQHEHVAAVHKLRMNQPLSALDLDELEHLLENSGVGGRGDIDRAREQAKGLGLFVRSLVGLDREAAKEAMSGFISGSTLTANQIQFVNLIINHLAEHGVMPLEQLYESPFTDITPQGPEGLFTASQLTNLKSTLQSVYESALVA